VWIFNPGIGLFNYYSGYLGIPRIEWLYDRHWALPAIILKKQLDGAVDAKVTPKEAMATVQKQVEGVIKR